MVKNSVDHFHRVRANFLYLYVPLCRGEKMFAARAGFFKVFPHTFAVTTCLHAFPMHSTGITSLLVDALCVSLTLTMLKIGLTPI